VSLLPGIHVKESVGMPFRRIMQYTMQEILANWRLIRHNHNLSFPITQLTITQSILGVILALAPALSLAILGIPIQHASHYLIFPAGIGMILGVVLIERITVRVSRTRVIAVGLLVAAVGLILLGLANRLHDSGGPAPLMHYQIGLLVAPIILILGFVNALVSVAAQTILQEHTDESSRGKVFGALGMMVNIASTLPIFFAGILADLTSVQTVVAALGIILLGFGAAQYYRLRKRGKLV
jgi:MFS family permease